MNIVVINSKGGASKSTVALQVASTYFLNEKVITLSQIHDFLTLKNISNDYNANSEEGRLAVWTRGLKIMISSNPLLQGKAAPCP